MDEAADENVKVYAVWFNMLSSDAESKWPSELLVDARVEHYWDAEKVLGTWYGKNVTNKPNAVEWDAYFLYGADSEWQAGGPTDMISWGRTIVESRDDLKRDLFQLLEASQ